MVTIWSNDPLFHPLELQLFDRTLSSFESRPPQLTKVVATDMVRDTSKEQLSFADLSV
jgi:hypothetical protein